jgi:DNA sulfur modification protein DndB
MNNTTKKTLVLPALRGVMGEWIYYSCLMNLNDLADRVRYAQEIHNNKNLSEMIQRKLKTNRSKEIASYILDQKEHFFNSLVIATYDGNPNWYSMDNISSNNPSLSLPEISEDIVSSIGFLSFNGKEKLFAIDGQHRLSGIKEAIKRKPNQEPWDEISVIFVSHKNDSYGKEKTRRLFTTLNKTARPVSTGDIIALDEDDVMAITTRRLIENTDYFSENRIAFAPTNNMPVGNKESLTTIGNLYKLLTILFVSTKEFSLSKPKKDLIRIRPSDEILDKYFEFSEKFFSMLSNEFSEINDFFNSSDYGAVTEKYRGDFGGNVLFRPIGLELFVQVISHIVNKKVPLNEAIRLTGKLPRNLNNAPFRYLLWHPSSKTMQSSQHLVTIREVLLNMLGYSKHSTEVLANKYQKAIGDDNAVLPML